MSLSGDTRPDLRTPTSGFASSSDPGQDSSSPRTGRRGLPHVSALDGVRAIAVLAVMIYHADLPWMPGGFLGVDIFFVLSGFLITSLVLSELERTGRLDFKQFYIRRARRLLPALFLVLAAAAVIGAFLATDAAAGLRRDIPAALLYVTNWSYVFSDMSYFETMGRPPLLQHLWSLAVEEQFYLLWPLVVFLAFRRSRPTPGRTLRDTVRRWALIGALASTALMVVLSLLGGYPDVNDGSRVYFGADSHAMGLLIGAALATLWLPQRARQPIASARLVINVIAAASLGLIVLIMMTTNSASAWLYRGGFLVFAVLVAVMLVAVSHPSSRVGQLLGRQPWRYIGERSYGLYLWHWPIFLVLRPGIDVPLSGPLNLALRFGLTFLAAELSYRFVEMPIRTGALRARWTALRALPRSERRPRMKRVLIVGGAVGLVVALSGFRIATLPEESYDYLGGATEISALDTTPQKQRHGDTAGDADGTDPSLSNTITPSGAATSLRPGVLAIGESVMLGARNGLREGVRKSAVDAAVGRQAADVLTRIKALRVGGALRQTVVLHTGSNGYVERKQLDAMLAELSDVERLVIVNVSVPRIWQDPNNKLLEQAVLDTPNAVLADWHAVVEQEDGLTVNDGVHLTTKGITRYAETISAAVDTITAAQQEAAQATNPDGEPQESGE